ncbi:hypothetical protein GTO87_00780 [Ligilactobacillus saerimneri]|uniref:Uncharacterized protein n=1 Tax=Ligilactobacillus saerimneri TaxID=228229 RepID=A0A7H9EHW9_9LACO|nr:hypothetical protein [Ligilactobacillus saerimneri]QLL77293.1 hypothetical protein GTO87_00780 [Ligilactobacillus saerimneri]
MTIKANDDHPAPSAATTTPSAIVSAQVIAINPGTLTLRTQDQKIIIAHQPQFKNRSDHKLYVKTMMDICRSGLWIPVDMTTRQLLQYDWFDTPATAYSF